MARLCQDKIMTRVLIIFCLGLALISLLGNAWSWEDNNDIFGNDYGLLSPMEHDAYGPGIHSDATGRPFKFKTFDGEDIGIFKVKPDAYGPGVGMDEFGRPVRAVPLDEDW